MQCLYNLYFAVFLSLMHRFVCSRPRFEFIPTLDAWRKDTITYAYSSYFDSGDLFFMIHTFWLGNKRFPDSASVARVGICLQFVCGGDVLGQEC